MAIFLITMFPLKSQIKDEFPFNVTCSQKCSTADFFNLKTRTLCHYIQHVTLHKSIVCLAVTNLKYKDYNNFYQFFLLFSGDVSLNPGPFYISPAVNTNIWKPLNKKGLLFLHINMNSLHLKIN